MEPTKGGAGGGVGADGFPSYVVRSYNQVFSTACLARVWLLHAPSSPAPPCDFREQREKERCREFITSYRSPTFAPKGASAAAAASEEEDLPYLQLVNSIPTSEAATRFVIDLDDIQLQDPSLAMAIVQNAKRYADLFAAAIDELLPAPMRALGDGTIRDVLQTARLSRLDGSADAAGDAGAMSDADLQRFFPARLHRKYEVRFTPLSSARPLRLRDISATSIGKFVTAECMVIRATDVKPLIEVASYAW